MADPIPALDRRIARYLLDIQAVSFSPEDPFTWSSGLRAPVYCDNRLTMGYPEVRRTIAEGFAAVLREGGLLPQVVVGTATAGIPHAAWLADRLELPMAYVRSAAKAHGRGRQVEGRLEPGQSVVIVEDLVSTGGSSLEAVDVVRAGGAEVRAVLAIFSYGFPEARDRFAAAGVALHTLTRFNVLFETAAADGALPTDALETLRAWQDDPRGWSRAFASRSD